MSNLFPEVKGFGSLEPKWPAIPERHTVQEVAAHYLRHRIAIYLRSRNITAADLAGHLGDTETAWRSRLNTTRGLSTDHLVALCLLCPDLVDEVMPRSTEVDDWLPASYAGLARGPVEGSGVPVFRMPDVDWITTSSVVAQWWSTGVSDGTAPWAVNASVLAHQVLQCVHGWGLPRDLATLGGAVESLSANDVDTESLRIDWINRDTSITVLWLSPFEAPRAAQVRRLLAVFAEALWADRSDALSVDVSIVAAPAAVIASIRDLLREPSAGETSIILSLNEARRLGATDPTAKADLQVTTLDGRTGPLLWFQAKG